jgi:hypothetical protein
MPDNLRVATRNDQGRIMIPLKGNQMLLPNNEAETDGGIEDFDDTLFDTYDDDSEIDGDCNESQPCRGDEPELDYDLH